MKKFTYYPLFIAVLATTALSGCASTPDPAVVCTSEWISPRADKAIDRIETRLTRTFKNLRGPAKAWANGKTPNPFQLLTLQSSLNKLEKELTEWRGITDLKMLARTCNDPVIVTDSLRGLWQDQGFPDQLIDFVENSGIYERVLDGLETAETAS